MLWDILKLIIAAGIGYAIAVYREYRLQQTRKASVARKLAVAFWEELSATNFYEINGQPNFTGFSSQTFDSLFREMAESMPDDLARDLMRYHWRMKFLDEERRRRGQVTSRNFWKDSASQQENLRARLKHYADRSVTDIRKNSNETWDENT